MIIDVALGSFLWVGALCLAFAAYDHLSKKLKNRKGKR